jgi:hypothetical protein
VYFAASREGLLNFRNAVENWPQFAAANEIQGWTDDLPMCLWTGILCNDEGAASSLVLPCTTCTVRARGRLPPDLSLLRTLQTVNLEGQAFYGGIPPQWFFSGESETSAALLLVYQLVKYLVWRAKDYGGARFVPWVSILSKDFCFCAEGAASFDAWNSTTPLCS